MLPLAHLTRCPQRIRALRLAAQAEMLHDNLQAKTVGFNVELFVSRFGKLIPTQVFLGSKFPVDFFFLKCIIFIIYKTILDDRRSIIAKLHSGSHVATVRPALRVFKMPVMRCVTPWLCGASCARWGRHGRTGQGQQWKIDFLDGLHGKRCMSHTSTYHRQCTLDQLQHLNVPIMATPRFAKLLHFLWQVYIK